MEFNGFTDKANDALNCALTCAMSMGHTYVGSEHILYGLACVSCYHHGAFKYPPASRSEVGYGKLCGKPFSDEGIYP